MTRLDSFPTRYLWLQLLHDDARRASSLKQTLEYDQNMAFPMRPSSLVDLLVLPSIMCGRRNQLHSPVSTPILAVYGVLPKSPQSFLGHPSIYLPMFLPFNQPLASKILHPKLKSTSCLPLGTLAYSFSSLLTLGFPESHIMRMQVAHQPSPTFSQASNT